MCVCIYIYIERIYIERVHIYFFKNNYIHNIYFYIYIHVMAEPTYLF